MSNSMILTFRYRIKDASTKRWLCRFGCASNQVWNFCVATQREAARRYASGMNVNWPSAITFNALCRGVGKSGLDIHSDTVSEVCRQFARSRDTHKRCPRFRSSGGSKRALGWVPFIPRAIKVAGDCVIYLKRKFRFWKSREISGKIKTGAFVEDARGRWYVTFQCEVAAELATGSGKIGIDLGLKTLAICTDGTNVPAIRHYRRYEAQLAVAQRAGARRRVRAIHAKIANARRHHLHEHSTRIARENALIVVGNVSAAKLAKTRMSKSVLDAGWSTFRSMLEYKARRHRARYVEADERNTSRTCSDCGAVSGPKGIAGLGVRHWQCASCGASHDRDVNAAWNILRVGLERQAPAVGISSRLG